MPAISLRVALCRLDWARFAGDCSGGCAVLNTMCSGCSHCATPGASRKPGINNDMVMVVVVTV
jgi:hypothetical protein